MGDSESDEDLERAIQLSLEVSRECQYRSTTSVQPKGSHEIINLDSDGDTTTDDDRTTDDSSQQTTPKKAVSLEKEMEPVVKPPSSSVLGLDRKAMEQERLARKRKAEISPPPVRKFRKVDEGAPIKLLKQATESTPSNLVVGLESISTAGGEVQFPFGTIKKTWVFGHDMVDDMKLEEVLQKNDLKLAVLSSFQWDVEWLLPKINTKATQLIFVMQANTEDIKSQYRRETAAMPNLRLCFPSMEGQINCMHSKLMLLSFPTHLRIVVPTANLVPYDWGETGVMENSLFLIDLPRLESNRAVSNEDLPHFGKDLVFFLNAMGLDKTIVESIYNFDFSATEDLAFVHTIGGAHGGATEPWRRTGYCGLGRALGHLGLKTSDSIAVDYVTSSIGSLNSGFLTAMHLAMKGDDGMAEYKWRYPLSKKKKESKDSDDREIYWDSASKEFRIYFPTEDTVSTSIGGPHQGGTICFQPQWWDSPKFPRTMMRDCKSQRQGMLMHNKLLFVRPTAQKKTQETSISTGWVYIGSANLSESAWGKLVMDRVQKTPKMNCRNWECGVVVPLRRATKLNRSGQVGNDTCDNGLAAFAPLLPIPIQYPGAEYGSQRPWFYSTAR